jgi:peptidoglycan/LPS O-acetylase OafA/YrhL
MPERMQDVATPHRKLAISKATSQFLDLSRWTAAFFVVFSHVRSITLANYPDITTHFNMPANMLVKSIYFAAGFGHMSVVVFFVISGFLVGGRATLKAAKGGFSLLDYAVHRFARIYIVLLPALIVGLVWDKLGATTDNFGLYTNTSHFHWWMIDDPITQRLGLLTWLGNLFMLQTIFVEPLGSNGPLWSLANEWWYYVIFGLAVALFLYPKPASRLACCLGIVALLVWLPFAITVWFALWLLGVGVAVVEQRWRGWPAPVGIAVLLAVIISERLLPATGTLRNQFFLDFGLAIGFSVALLCAKRGRWALGNLHPWLASFSYTTYLVHVPAMALLVVVVHRAFGFGIGEQPGLASIGFMAALIATLYLYAWIFASLTEFQTERARVWLRRFVDANFVNTTPRGASLIERSILAASTTTATSTARTADAKPSR